ncbi:peptidase MA family metallohydrolase [Nocardia shimofusensis]|uniref:peptidase MA family metallohydrolase n=1 Tax=Nocardia shimofusensis TaxID=228596 RepID=UPI000829FA00|nr:hypothetical protein [Nocardia shimofusensis]
MTEVHPLGFPAAARDRGRFLFTVAVIALLTASGCALIRLIPEAAAPLADAAPAGTAHLEPARRIMAPFGELREIRAPDTEAVVLAHPGNEELADRLAAELPAALSAVAGFWDASETAWTRHAVVVVAADRTEFAALLRAPEPAAGGPQTGADAGAVPGGHARSDTAGSRRSDDSGATAVDVTSTDIAAAAFSDPFVFGTSPTGQRVVFAPDAGERLTPDQLRTLLRHELTHLATRAHTAGDAPQWLTEGFADYVAHRGLGHTFAEIAPTVRAAARSGALPDAFPADTAFTGPAAVEAYEQAWTICAFVAAAYDEPRLLHLYRTLAGSGRADEDRLLREVLGTDRASFADRWRSWVADRSG